MGMSSLYCGISRITITENTECVILPLIDRSKKDFFPFYYCEKNMLYIPQILPIFGKQDGYSNMVDVKHNENTKIIEKYFSISIEEFLEFILLKSYGDKNKEILKKAKNKKELDTFEFMVIHKEVYDFLIQYNKEEIFEKFKHIHCYKKIDFNYELNFLNVLGCDDISIYDNYITEKFKIDHGITRIPFINRDINTIRQFYRENFDHVIDSLKDLYVLVNNMYYGSYFFEPYRVFISPQFGEFEKHQIILEKFAEINKKELIKQTKSWEI